MYLKSLKLAGFKSFADRTRLEFRNGVTVVVGPNGAGKSNLVDAVSWVMGTQSTRALRTERMDDVIFAGTATRPGLSRAEVTLIFDNADRLLPLDLPEVAITRRLYRDGQSEYEINGAGCRLLDITDLLSDSGVGRQQHIIVSQGQIDSVLNADPEAHRQVIEEAAGILKHRLRKERALRRLERTDADLTRLRDLLGEINRQVRPLKRQAEAAARHDEVASRVRELVIYLGGRQLAELAGRQQVAEAAEGELLRQSQRAQAVVDETRALLDRLTPELAVAETNLDRDTGAAARLETTLERLRRIGAVAGERRRAGLARVEGRVERRRDLEEESATVEAELAQLVGAEGMVADRTERAERRVAELEDELRSIAEQEALAAGGGAAALIRGDIASLQGTAERDQREAESIARRLDVLAAELVDDRNEAVRLTNEIRTIDEEVAPSQLRYQQAEGVRRRDQAAWEAAEAAEAEGRLASAAAAARLEAFSHLVVDRGADPLVALTGAPGVVGTLTSRLEVPGDLRPAVEAALGAMAGGVAVTDLTALESAVAHLKSLERGGVALVPANVDGAGVESCAVAAATLGMPRLVDLLGGQADRKLAERLLGDVVLAEDWLVAWKAVQLYPRLRAVTRAGDVAGALGVVVARPEGASHDLLESARRLAKEADLEAARARSRLMAARRAFESSRETERVALEALEALESQMAGATDALGRLQRLGGGVSQEIARLEERGEALRAAEVDRAARLADLGARLAAVEGDEDQRQLLWEGLAERRQAAAIERDRARADWQGAAEELGAQRERRALLEARAEALRSELARPEGARPEGATLDKLADVEEAARRGVVIVKEKLEVLRSRQAELRAVVDRLLREVGIANRRHDEGSEALADTRGRLAAVAVELTELRLRTEAMAAGLRRDAGAGGRRDRRPPVAPCVGPG